MIPACQRQPTPYRFVNGVKNVLTRNGSHRERIPTRRKIGQQSPAVEEPVQRRERRRRDHTRNYISIDVTSPERISQRTLKERQLALRRQRSESAGTCRNSQDTLPQAAAAAAGSSGVLADGEAHAGSAPDLGSASSDLGESNATDFPG